MTGLIVDNFAGGGGASAGIEEAMGRPIDIAINHDKVAIAMHEVNHPNTKHYHENIWDVDPEEVCAGRPVSLAWFSPDCTHFSKAKGGRPVKKEIRGLAWVVLKWIDGGRPEVIMLENVEEFITWGPLIRNRKGEHHPDPKQKGKTFKVFIKALEKRGYNVEWKSLRASSYGAPTIRKRLFLIARCDGNQIVWPEPTHGDPKSDTFKSGIMKPWRTAAECINWGLSAPSIFERKKPLAETTQRRIAKGMMKYVINHPDPFIVTYYGDKKGEFRGQPLDEPLKTQTSENRHALVMPHIIRTDMHKSNAGCHYDIKDPLRTVTSSGGHAVVAAFMARHMGQSIGSNLKEPARTMMQQNKDSLVTSHIVKLKGTNIGQDVRTPLHTITAGGTHFGEVRAFLLKYYGTDQDPKLKEPLHTVTTKDRFGLVTVHGENYMINDIGMRMLQPRELFNAQSFKSSYIIDRDSKGNKITKTQQVAKCGNSVCPDMAAALVRVNVAQVTATQDETLAV